MYFNGLIGLFKNGKAGYVDINGKEIIPFTLDEYHPFWIRGNPSEERRSVRLLRKDGSWAVAPKFEKFHCRALPLLSINLILWKTIFIGLFGAVSLQSLAQSSLKLVVPIGHTRPLQAWQVSPDDSVYIVRPGRQSDTHVECESGRLLSTLVVTTVPPIQSSFHPAEIIFFRSITTTPGLSERRLRRLDWFRFYLVSKPKTV